MSLYVHDRPVAGQGRYFGRELLLRSLLGGVERGRSFLLLGGPRTGRSSTLLQIIHMLQLGWARSPDAVKVAPVHYDLKASLAAGERNMVSGLWAAILHGVLDPRVTAGAKPPRPPKPDFGRAEDPWEELRRCADEVFDALSGTGGWCRWVLLCDHGDALRTRQMEDAAGLFARFIQSKGPGAPAAAVIAGGRALSEWLKESSTPLRFLRPLLLSALKQSEAEALIRMGFPDADATWVERVCATSGRHPYLLQLLLAEYQQRGPDTSYDEILKAVQPNVAALCKLIWDELDIKRGVTYRGAYAAPEHALMQLLLDHDAPVNVRAAERELGIHPLKEYAELLESAGVVERVLRGDVPCYSPQCALWNGWYTERIRR